MKSHIRWRLLTIACLVAAIPVTALAQDYIQVRPNVPHGMVQSVAYKSKSLGTDRKIMVYTPPGYEQSTGRYPLLYLLHGAGSDETSWTQRGMAHVILDNLIAEGKMKPVVVVMPFGFAAQRAPGAGRGDAAENKMQREGFLKDFLEDVMPFVDSKYRVYTDREHRAIAGLSLGGAQALAIGVTHIDLFSRIAAFSPAMGASNNPATGGIDFETVLAQNAARLNKDVKLLYVSCGTEDTLFASIRDFTGQLSKHKVEHTYRVTGGAHVFPVWQRNLVEVAPLLVPEQ
ncbi:MAG TPA: alpha/beta hydrolase-fold protein [Terriglobia bacterium]|nr:alpha/beta hydrolase-fold protein [Terriglobia bacterium]